MLLKAASISDTSKMLSSASPSLPGFKRLAIGLNCIAIAFYMAHPRLMRLERKMMDEVEGGNANWLTRIMRHEFAHALSAVLPCVSFDRGMDLANLIHNTGRLVVWSGHRERAELYWEQLKNHGLTMAPLDRV